MARTTDGHKHARRVEASKRAQRRLEAILETLSGNKTVAEVCEELEINEARFHVIRKQALQAAADRLEPQPTGRPRKEQDERDERITELESELERKAIELRAAEVRVELALAMPDVIAARAPQKKDTPRLGVRAKLGLRRNGPRRRRKV